MAVANNAIVVGADGEVWKCWDDIGNPDKTVGDIRNYRELDEQAILPWLLFNPTEDPQCSSCIALPSCMGGCLHHTLAGHPRDAQCGSFRFNYQEQIRRTVLQRTGNPHRSAVLETVAASRLAAELSAQERQWQPVELRVGHRSSAFT